MWIWTLREFSHFVFLLFSLSLLWNPLLQAQAEEKTGSAATVSPAPNMPATLQARLLFLNIRNFQEYNDIRLVLERSPLVQTIKVDSMRSGMITMTLQLSGEPKNLLELIETQIPKKYSMEEKQLPSGIRELLIRPLSEAPVISTNK